MLGEASVIVLARSRSAEVVLIDEQKARKIARTIYGLHVVGSARVLVEAKRHGILDNVAVALRMMRERGYWIHEAIVQQALQEAGEIPHSGVGPDAGAPGVPQTDH